MMQELPRTLLDAYLDTDYLVATPEGRTLRLVPGQPCPALDALMAEAGCTSAAFITAWNPGSRALPRECNASRQHRLAEQLAAAGYRFLEGYGVAPDGSWHEDSLLVLGIPARGALRLARRFGQNAILTAEQGGPVRLVPIAGGRAAGEPAE